MANRLDPAVKAVASEPTTVVICTKGRSECVAEAVSSLLIDPNEDVVLIVVDQNEDDRVVGALAPYSTDDRLRHVRVGLAGAGRARNTALELAATPVVCFTDDDCVAPSGWARTMTQLMVERPDVSLVFGSVSAIRTADDHLGYTPDFIIEREVELASWGLDARVDHLGIGACMAVRRSDVLAIGGFDPMMGPGSLFPSADDRELAIRLLLADRKVLMTPAGGLEHAGFRLNGDAARAHSKRDHYALGGDVGQAHRCERSSGACSPARVHRRDPGSYRSGQRSKQARAGPRQAEVDNSRVPRWASSSPPQRSTGLRGRRRDAV